MSRVLIVEDEVHLAHGLQFNLQAEGHATQIAGDGETALELLLGHGEEFDAVLLDVMLPGKDGFLVASELRAAQNFVPVLMLTARGRPEDVLKGFASGADDYIAKPFELPILLARLQGLLRRRQWMRHAPPSNTPAREAQTQSEYEFDRFTVNGRIIDFGNLELRAKGKITRLTVMEAELLRYLIRSRGRVVSRKSILEQVWGLREDTDTRAIDNFIVRLRRYLEDNPAHPKYLLTVRGVGYKFKGETAAAQVGEQKTGGR
jgi:DNA-binding response OmpR family regulator